MKPKYWSAYRERQKAMTDPERFWPKVDKGPHPKGCWYWTAALEATGYGHFKDQAGKDQRAHRWAYEQAKGPIPAGMSLMHSCDVKKCVNPDHLEVGTHRQNMIDKNLRGRDPRCLTPEKVREIRAELEADKSYGAVARIAAKHGICSGVASQIKLRRKYAYVE